MVFYDPYQWNPDAADGIIELARRLLGDVPGTELRIGPVIHSDRVVAHGDGKVVKMTTWQSEADREAYFKHLKLQEYVRAVLRGWRLDTDPDGPDSLEPFVAHILSGKDDKLIHRDGSVPDSEVLWGGEEVVQFSW